MAKRIVKNNNTCADICDVSLALLWHARSSGGLKFYDYEERRFAIIDRAAWITFKDRHKLTGRWGEAKLRVKKQLRDVYVLQLGRWDGRDV